MKAYADGILDLRIKAALEQLSCCTLCPRSCRVNRTASEKGICQTGRLSMISGFGPHFGEESPLVGSHGSGTIFFAHCNLLCNFCQNYDISHQGRGQEITDKQLGLSMLDLQTRGCHNINLVTPSHVIPQILSALKIAIEGGLKIPLVYNTGGYDAGESLKLLDGIVDIYMPDLKFLNKHTAIICNLPLNYPEVVKKAITEMHRQVGDLKMNRHGLATRGLLVRHLVMPGDLANSENVMAFLANEISQNTCVNIMDQYRPCFKARSVSEISRSITPTEIKEAREAARRNGLPGINL